MTTDAELKLYCQVTQNECGTDTWPVDRPCECRPCQSWLGRRLAELVEERDHEYVERLAALSLLGKAESEVARLREALEKYANEENWTRHCQYDLYREWVPEEEHGYDTAQEALKEPNNAN